MDYTLVIDPQYDEGFLATVPALPGCKAVGQSREQALTNVRAAIEAMLNRVEVVRVSVDDPRQCAASDPWLTVAGQFRDDPTFDPMMENIYRERSGEYPE